MEVVAARLGKLTLWVIFDRVCGLCLPSDVRFPPKATKRCIAAK
jgi:hypothetical protein